MEEGDRVARGFKPSNGSAEAASPDERWIRCNP